MSQFIGKLKQMSHGAPQSMGFRKSGPSPQKPGLLLLSWLDGDTEAPADYASAADAGVLSIGEPSAAAAALDRMTGEAPGIPWGGWLTKARRGDIEQVAKAGDFVVFPADSAFSAMPQDGKAGRVLQVEASSDDGLLRAINALPVDAVLVTGEEGGDDFLTWRQLMVFQRFSNLVTKPLLATATPQATADELQALWQAGVRGVLVKAEPRQPAAELKKLRQIIDSLTFSPPPKHEVTLLPQTVAEPQVAEEEEEEEHLHTGH
ncbi:MAG: hypothetical protein HY530_06910 [Chloroflexi bacterium]|nr:hypothetical protein [Chloroflexota bacterium]